MSWEWAARLAQVVVLLFQVAGRAELLGVAVETGAFCLQRKQVPQRGGKWLRSEVRTAQFLSTALDSATNWQPILSAYRNDRGDSLPIWDLFELCTLLAQLLCSM